MSHSARLEEHHRETVAVLGAVELSFRMAACRHAVQAARDWLM